MVILKLNFLTVYVNNNLYTVKLNNYQRVTIGYVTSLVPLSFLKLIPVLY